MKEKILKGLDRPEILQRFSSTWKIEYELDNLPEKNENILYKTTNKLICRLMKDMWYNIELLFLNKKENETI